MITFFRTLSETDKPFYSPIETALERIKGGKSKHKVELIRNEPEKEARNKIKKELPAVCFSGKFTNRNASSIVEHSGFICLDFDGFSDEFSLALFRHRLVNDPYSFAVFTSPSGDGLKMIVKIPKDIENHKSYFIALQEYFNVAEFDKSCKDISRVCYESYDPELYHNPQSEEWTKLAEKPKAKEPVYQNTIKLEDQSEIVRRLLIWWEKNFGMVEGAKNNNLFILASTLNVFGIDRYEALSIVLSFDEGGKEDEITALFNSAYKNEQDFGTKFFEDLDTLDNIKTLALKGTPVEEIAEIVKPISIEKVKEVIKEVKDKSFKEFWSKNSKGAITHINHLYKQSLEEDGFFKFYPADCKNFVFIRMANNIIQDCTDDDIKDHILDNLFKLDDMSIYNYFAEKTKLFREDHLSFLNRLESRFIKDDENTAHIYFRNCAVKVTGSGYEAINYEDLGAYIWEKQKIDRDFKKTDFDGCMYQRFIRNIGGKNEKRIKTIETTAGYLMHSYKPPGFAPAVIINDEVISDNPEGGTGKGIYVHAIGQLKKAVIIDGKAFSFQKSFPYQRVSADTQTLVFDDVSKNFDFERLFSVITEGITLEKKNKDEIHIPFEDSPKIIITTNYAIKGTGNSFERRKWELEFAQHYHKDFTPEDEFKCQLFSGWDDCEWNKFDNYMLNNLKEYLSQGLAKSDFKNLAQRKFIASTSMEFYEWASDSHNKMMKLGYLYDINDIYLSFYTDNPDYGPRGRMNMTVIRFAKWLDAYGDYAYGCRPTISRNNSGKMYTFVRKEDEQLRLEI